MHAWDSGWHPKVVPVVALALTAALVACGSVSAPLLWGGKSPSSSSGTRVNMVETAENGSGDDAAAATPLTRERTGQRQGAVRPIVVVVAQEFG